MLQLTGVRKTFFPGTVNERVALDGIDLTLPPGDFATVIGSNGAGKSTLLNIIAGYMTPDTGRVDIDGRIVNRLSDHQRAKYIGDRKSTRLNSSHVAISYAVFCLKK